MSDRNDMIRATIHAHALIESCKQAGDSPRVCALAGAIAITEVIRLLAPGEEAPDAESVRDAMIEMLKLASPEPIPG